MSGLEEAFLRWWSLLDASRNLPTPSREHVFHPVRKWRFDFAWIEQQVAVEIHGGIWSRGKSGHTSGRGVTRDAEKAREAAKLGWTVLAYTTDDIRKKPVQVIEEVAEVLRMRRA